MKEDTMTEQTATAPTANNSFYTTPEPTPKKRAWWKAPAVWVAAAALTGIAIGAGSAPEPKTVEVEKIVEKPTTVEKRVEVPVTPAVCLNALSLSEEAFDFAAEAMGYTNDALQAAGRMDVRSIEAANVSLKEVTPKMQALAPRLNAAKADCRATAK